MNVECYEVNVTTSAAGAVDAYTPNLTGRLLNIAYVKPASDGLATATFAITAEKSGLTLWGEASINASKTVAPSQPIHGSDGDALVYAAGGEGLAMPVFLAYERIKIAITNGGDALSGSFKIYVAGPN